ncbi:uncharacterized protein LOC128885281 isoform X1 [Hylaeus anthracinus]|uniref:uncharacterized protein LOC128885281 isoform X1 n=2 Tax=Hylaeus anthracinus TaxID=313031 RepID=UPI0023B8E336|nr:uncharacterized protein LOC128885281 isoform X1 [Hylaeus anthracinus]
MKISSMSLTSFSFFYLSLLLLINRFVGSTITVTEVPVGHLAELPCLSSDDDHRFMFWQLTDDRRIIGPGNEMDENKYNYEVLTGKLFIRGVSTAESGFYKCISKGISNHSSINIHKVELIVKKDWEDVWENDFETNLLRGMAATMVVVVAVAIVLFVITTKRKRSRRFFDFEESRENSPAKYTTRVSAAPTLPIPIVEEGGIDNAALDIDFPRVLRQMQK